MRFYLTEAFTDPDAPKLSGARGKINWAEVFKTSHPIDSTASGYKGMTEKELWSTFFENDTFKEATGINVANAGTLLYTSCGSLLQDELLACGFSMASNPFLKFFNDILQKASFKSLFGASGKLGKTWSGIHNSVLKKHISTVDLETKTAIVGALLRNPVLYESYSAYDLYLLYEVIHELPQSNLVIKDSKLSERFKELGEGLIKENLIKFALFGKNALAIVKGSKKLPANIASLKLDTATTLNAWSEAEQVIKALTGVGASGATKNKTTPPDVTSMLKDLKTKLAAGKVSGADKIEIDNINSFLDAFNNSNNEELRGIVGYLAIRTGNAELIGSKEIKSTLTEISSRVVTIANTLNYEYSAKNIKNLLAKT